LGDDLVKATDESVSADAALKRFAWRVAGPREFLINVVLNGIIAAIAYRRATTMTVAGIAPLLAYFGPMSFLLPLLTTFFGYFNGLVARRAGVGSPCTPEIRWKAVALRSGLVRGCACCPACILACLAVQAIWPGLQFSKWMGVALIGLVAGVLGYVLHGAAVCRSARLGRDG
jgi:hypothetical protein